MARSAGAEDFIHLEDGKWKLVVDDTALLTVSSDGIEGATLQSGSVSSEVVSATSQTTLSVDQQIVFGDTTAGSFGVELPTAAAGKGRKYTITKTDSNATELVISSSAGNINGKTTGSLGAQYESTTAISDGSEWFLT